MLPLGSTTPMGIPREGLVLIVSRALEMTPKGINNTADSPLFHEFGANAERILASDLLTHATAWYLARQAPAFPTVGVAYLDGKSEPGFSVADGPLSAQLLNADRIEYRIKHPWSVAAIETRNMIKNVPV
jgi:hypothetical protein